MPQKSCFWGVGFKFSEGRSNSALCRSRPASSLKSKSLWSTALTYKKWEAYAHDNPADAIMKLAKNVKTHLFRQNSLIFVSLAGIRRYNDAANNYSCCHINPSTTICIFFPPRIVQGSIISSTSMTRRDLWRKEAFASSFCGLRAE